MKTGHTTKEIGQANTSPETTKPHPDGDDKNPWDAQMETGQPTRTPQTTARYLDRARKILRNIPSSFMANPEFGLDPAEIVEYLRQTAPTLRKNSFRYYKAALVCYMEYMGETVKDSDSAKNYLSEAESLKKLSQKLAAPRKSLPDRTSSSKKMYVNQDDLSKLGRFMMKPETQRVSKWAGPAYSWLAAGIAAGLRPIEWQTASIIERTEEGGITLRVANAKNTNGRAGTEFREVPVEAGWPSDYAEKHLASILSWVNKGNDYDDYYEGCRHALNRSVRLLWPKALNKHYSLYSGRHQFCANCKKEGLSEYAIAVLMGHASEETAGTHYGKKRSGFTKPQGKITMPSIATPGTPPKQSM